MIILFLMVTVAVATATDNGPSDETFLVGPMDFDGFCPEPSHKYGKSCCCAAGCCWSNCRKGNPPQSCLDGVPNSQWVFNRDKLWYQAVRNFNHQGCNVNNTFWPMDCPDLTVPKSLVKVKVWYDNGFLQSKQIQTHEKAKEFIYATMAHVQHFMCSSSIGTVLETELVEIEYMQNLYFNVTSKQAIKDMKPVIEGDNSTNVNIHLAFINHCNGGRAYRSSICKAHPLAVNCINDHKKPLAMAQIVTHEMGHVLGMRHDEDIGCGKHNEDYGHMSGTHNRWSSCSKQQFSERYTHLAMKKKWCLQPAKSEDACKRVQSSMKGPYDVGFAGQCPSPSYKEGDKCCCGEGCCWDKCTWENPPNDCLNGLYKGQWLFDIVKEHFFAVNYWENSVSCDGDIKPKECVVETFLVGPKDFGGSCPSPSHKYGQSCCCESACCWGNCRKDNPPRSCLDGVPNSQWVYNTEKLRYQAVRNYDDKGCEGKVVAPECLDKALSIKGPKDVGAKEQCPSPAYEDNGNCCCSQDCCWDKCTLDNPPDDCLKGVIKGHWMFDETKGYFTAVKYWNGSVVDCTEKVKPKECVVETLLVGPQDVDGSCPSPTHKYRNSCCCQHGCCWGNCRKGNPPQDCLDGVPNSRWIKDNEKGYFIAVRNWNGSDLNSP